MKTVWLLVTSVVLISYAMASDNWQSLRSNKELQAWFQKQPQSYTLVRVETVVNAPLPQLLPLLQDAASQHQWLPYTHKVSVIRKPSPFDTLVHFQTESKWPFKPRDAVTLFRVSQPSSNEVMIKMENQPNALNNLTDYVRIEQSEGYWLLTALEHCQTQLRYQSGSKWGGNIPQWLVNKMNRTLAIEALSNLKSWAPRHYKEFSPYDYLAPTPLHKDCR